jgi:hypothetical protein
MNRRGLLYLMTVVLAAVTLCWGVDRARAQQQSDSTQAPKAVNKLEKAQEKNAAARRYYGFPRSMTNADRRAAAKRNAARLAAPAPQNTGGAIR